jgi:uncharacterized membrane protein YcaP (DUF421 family)
MDPLRVLVRAAFAYALLLVLVRRSGKRTIHQGSAFDFAVVLIAGDLVDDAVWGEVAAAQFAIASVTLFAVHAFASVLRVALPGLGVRRDLAGRQGMTPRRHAD